MKRSVIVSFMSLALASTSSVTALAQKLSSDPGAFLFNTAPKYREAYLARLMQPFRSAAGDDQILTQEDVDRAELLSNAQQRSQIMMTFFAADMNGDLAVTAAEWQQGQAAALERVRVDRFSNWDADGNGVVTVEEAYTFAKKPPRAPAMRRNLHLSALMALEATQDGKLTASELEQEGRAAFARYDVDNDGVLSTTELERFSEDQRKRQQDQLRQATAAACGIPKPASADKVVFVSGYEAAALSTVTVAGQDEETNTAEINVEAGMDPIFIVATSYTPMIWRVTGATERVVRFVAGSHSGAGVVGLNNERITFVSGAGCIPGYVEPKRISVGGLDAINRVIGSPVSYTFASYTLSKVTLPADALPSTMLQPETTKRAVSFSWGPLRPADNVATSSLKKFSPGGVIAVDAGLVVSSGGAQPYEVLPQEAGLAQLLQDGALEFDPKLGYVIRRAIARFPAGLAGAHSVRFVLAEGVPRPAGRAGHSSVVTWEQANNIPMRSGPMAVPPVLPGRTPDLLRP